MKKSAWRTSTEDFARTRAALLAFILSLLLLVSLWLSSGSMRAKNVKLSIAGEVPSLRSVTIKL